MGKSPGKWIKRVLLGKKSSKSNLSKKDETGKEAFNVTKAPPADLAMNPPDSEHSNTIASMQKSSSETSMTISLPHGADPLLAGNQDADVHMKSTLESCSQNDGDALRQEQAAAKVQAAFRGYLARRAFWALKGIIRLQALIRGHLVRRQAVATLRCMQGIVKLQAVVRGRMVRVSDTGLEVHQERKPGKLVDGELLDSNGICNQPTKLSKNAFAQKLSASLPMAMPLSFQYDPMEPNSAWNWLERWSSSHFWEPLKEPKIGRVSKSHRKQGTKPSVEVETLRPKRSVRRAPTTTADNNSLPSTAENGKSRNNLKKANHHADLAVENPQNELEKVKRNLRKISLSKTQKDDTLEAASEKPKNKAIKEPDTLVHDVLEHVLNDSSEKQSEKAVTILKEPKTESAPEQLPDESLVPHDECPAVELPHLEDCGKDEVLSMVNEELMSKEEQVIKENNRTRRRKSLPAKQEYPENGSQNTPRIPSYMAATESAKAKLRAQGSQGLSPDVPENGPVRRHSLPSSRNGKLNSPSLRSHKLVQASGKGATKNDKSLLSSRDNNEWTIQAEWKR